MITTIGEVSAVVDFPVAYKLRSSPELIVLFCSPTSGVKLSGKGCPGVVGEMERWTSYDSISGNSHDSVWIPINIQISHK